MLSRILLTAITVAAGGIFVSAAATAGSDGDPSAAASEPFPEIAVAPPTDYPDVRIAGGSAIGGEVAFNPLDPKRLAVGIVIGTRCYVKASADGGRTWAELVQLPQLGDEECSDMPALTYAADGYAAYSYSQANNMHMTGSRSVCPPTVPPGPPRRTRYPRTNGKIAIMMYASPPRRTARGFTWLQPPQGISGV